MTLRAKDPSIGSMASLRPVVIVGTPAAWATVNTRELTPRPTRPTST